MYRNAFLFAIAVTSLLAGSPRAQLSPSAPLFVLPALAQLSGGTALPGDAVPAPMVGNQLEPQVAAGGGEYLAVWADERSALGGSVELDPWEVVQSDIFAMRLGPDGTPVDSLPIRVDAGAYSQVSPAVASNGTDWLIVYESRGVTSLGTSTSQDISAVRVSGSGVVLDSTPLSIDSLSTDAYVPDVASDGTNWAVFWTDTGRVLTRKITADGTVGPTITAAQPGYWLFDPAVAFAQDRYLVVWEGAGVVGRFLNVNLEPMGQPFLISNLGDDPRITTDGTDFFVTVKKGGSWPEVLGTVVRANGTVVSPGGISIDGQSFLPLGFPAVTWDGTGYVVSWLEFRFVFPAGPQNELKFNRVDSNGVLQYAEPRSLLLTSDFSIREPLAASLGNGNAFLGWLDSRNGSLGNYDGYGTIVDSAGNFSPEQSYLDSPPAQLEPDLAAGPTGTTLEDDVNLAVFISADSSETRIVFQRLDGTGSPLDLEPVVVAGGTDTYTNPTAAWNGVEWLIAWENRTGGSGNGGVLAARVLPDGTLLDATPIQVLEGNDPDVAALATVGGDFLVAASKQTSGDIRTIYSRRVASDGSLPDPTQSFVGVNYALSPTIGGFDDRWLVLWHRMPTHDTPSSTLQARFVLADGSAQPLLDPSNSTSDEMLADIVVQNDVATFTWGDGTDIRVRQVQKDGTFLGAVAGTIVSAAANEQTAPTISVDGAKIVVTWVDDRIHSIFEPGVGDLYGTRLDSTLMALEPEGEALAADPLAPEGEAALLGRMGVTIGLHPAMLPEFGTWRVSTNTWRDWGSMGSSLPGTGGDPRLWMSGLLTAGSQVRFEVSDALPNTIGFHIIGFSEISIPFQGGTMVPSLNVLLTFVTNSVGSRTKVATLTSALPAGSTIYTQTWLVDAGGVLGSAATEAFLSTSP